MKSEDITVTQVSEKNGEKRTGALLHFPGLRLGLQNVWSLFAWRRKTSALLRFSKENFKKKVLVSLV